MDAFQPFQMTTALMFAQLKPSADTGLEYVVIHATNDEPSTAVRFDDIWPIVNTPANRKQYPDPYNGKRTHQNWVISLTDDHKEVIFTLTGLIEKTFHFPAYPMPFSDARKYMDKLGENYRANMPDPDKSIETENFDIHVKGDSTGFAFYLDDLYRVLKTAKNHDVLTFDNIVFFPARPIRDMIRLCVKDSKWDAVLTKDADDNPVLKVTIQDTIKTYVTFKGTLERANVMPASAKMIPTFFVWNLPTKFHRSFHWKVEPETAVAIAPEPVEIAPETTPEPDPVVMVIETAAITPEPTQPTPEPEKQPDPVPVMVTTPQPTPQPQKRRQPAKKRVKMPATPAIWIHKIPDWFCPIPA